MEDTEGCELLDQLLGVAVGFFGLDIEFLADFAFDDFSERGLAVGCVPDDRGGFVQAEKRGIGGGHDHHFAAEFAGSDGSASRDVNFAHRISSQARASGVKTSCATSM